MAENKIKVFVRDRNKILFDDMASGVTSKNSRGVFDILTNHANFITLINETIYVHRQGSPDLEIPTNNAIVKAKENSVEIYIGVKRQAQ
jgi:hypothetical protein